MGELRRHPRAPLDVSVEFAPKGSSDRLGGHARDISLGGMFIHTSKSPPFGTELTLYIVLPGQKALLALPSVVRWVRSTPESGPGFGVQFGLIGARETHAITEIVRATK